MSTSFLSTQSRKAWVAGALSALLTPILDLLSGSNVLTIRTLVVAIISGLIAAAAVWVTDNADQGPPITPAAVPAAPATGAAPAATQAAAPDEFSGQTVPGE